MVDAQDEPRRADCRCLCHEFPEDLLEGTCYCSRTGEDWDSDEDC